MPTYNFIHPTTKDKISISGDTPPDEATLDQIFAETANAAIEPKVGKGAWKDRNLLKEAKDSVVSDVKDVGAMALEGAAGLWNAGVRSAKGYVGAANVPYQMMQGRSFDDALKSSADMINGPAFIAQAPESRLSKNAAPIIQKGVQKVSGATGIPVEALGAGLQGVGDIAAILGMKTPLTQAGKVVSAVTHPARSVRTAADAVAQRVAGRQLKAARTTDGPLVEQYAKNTAEAEALQAETGLKFDPARSSGDVNSIAALRQSLTKNGEAQALNEAQYLHNNTRLPEYLNENMPQNGSLDDFLAAIEKQKQGVANEATMAGQGVLDAELSLQGAGPEIVGSSLRDGAQGVRGALKQQADTLYAQVPKDMPVSEGMTYGQLMKERSDIGQAIRQAKASGDFSKAFDLSSKMGELENILKQAGEPKNDMFGTPIQGMGSQTDVLALRKANDFYRDTYVPTVRQGATSNVLKTTGTGGYAVDNALVGNQYFQQGAKGIEAAKSFKRTFGDSPDQLQAIQDYAFTSLKDANGGNLTTKGVDRWLYRHKEALSELGMTETFSGLRNKTLLAENAKKMQGVFDSSKAAKIIDSVDDKSKLESLFSGADAKDTGNTMKNVLRLVNGDELALGGLKKEFKDMILAKTNLLFEQDAAGIGGTSYAKLTAQLNKLQPAIELLYNAKEQKALSNARLAVQIENRAKKHAIAGTSDTAALSTTLSAAKAIERMAPLTWKYRAPKMVLDMFRQNVEGKASNNVARGLFDKSAAQGFIDKFDQGYSLMPDTSSYPRTFMGGLMSNTLQDDSSRP